MFVKQGFGLRYLFTAPICGVVSLLPPFIGAWLLEFRHHDGVPLVWVDPDLMLYSSCYSNSRCPVDRLATDA